MDLNQAENRLVLCLLRIRDFKNWLNRGREGKAMNALIRIGNAAPVFVIALSLVAASATTTDVIFSFEEEEGE